MIKEASENDILAIEEIMLDAVLWMRKNKLENQWNEENIRWSYLSKSYKITDFYIDYENGAIAGCMAITDEDRKYWPEFSKGQSLYLHKLAVKRAFSGKGVSKNLINFAKELSVKRGANGLRLDCNYKRDKLRGVYENEGFMYIDKIKLEKDYYMALYMWE